MVHKSTFHLKKMDCPTEERLVRMALQDSPGIATLSFDLQTRKVAIWHDGPVGEIIVRLTGLNLGAEHIETSTEANAKIVHESTSFEARTLKTVLAINAFMFLIEIALGFMAQSTGLIADSLDMFADAAVYGLSLYAVGRSKEVQKQAAHFSGWLQLALALGALEEVGRRAIWGSEPESSLIIVVAVMALCANLICLRLLTKHRDGGAHMKASVIFSTNDVLANLGVIVGGILVATTHSQIPDLIVGCAIAVMVFRGGVRILRL